MTATLQPESPWDPQRFFRLLSALYLGHLALRTWLSTTAGSDDADQLLFSQALAPGYDVAQQPLYTWLVWASGSVAISERAVPSPVWLGNASSSESSTVTLTSSSSA